MRVSTFSRLSVFAITLFASVFLISMYQVGAMLIQSQSQKLAFEQLKSLTQVQFYRTIADYLNSGDATRLTEANTQLQGIIASSQKVAVGNISNKISEKAQQLSDDIDNKFRAFGKLSADPLALIRNNEQGMVSLLQHISRYANESTTLSEQDRSQYLALTQQISHVLHQLIYQREKLFLNNLTLESMNGSIKELQTLSSKLSNLPLMQIIEEVDEDDLLFQSDDEPEDLSEEAINEYISLTKRYASEITNTLNLQNERLAALTLLSQEVSDIENIIVEGEQLITDEQNTIYKRLTMVVLGLLVLLVVFLLINYVLMRTIVLNPLRTLRNSFVALVEQGKVENITAISPKTELGEISQSFNDMVNKLANEDMQKADQLNLVANAMQNMEHQAKNILNSSASTSEHLDAAEQVLSELSFITEHLTSLANEVVDSAQATQQAMNDSEQKVSEALLASEQTNNATQAGKSAILSLSQSVESVDIIVDVIGSIADQTNLLALNAAIEAARAGEHGRGFSVVADEVRQLAGKTQDSLKQVSARLAQLNQASDTLTQNILGIETASKRQQDIAEHLQLNAASVVQQAIKSATIAANTQEQINKQRSHFTAFEQAMEQVNSEVKQSKTLAQHISADVELQVSDISKTLKLAIKRQ